MKSGHMDEAQKLTKEYKKNFLTNVVFKIDFPQITNLTKTEQLHDFHEKVNKLYPTLKEIKRGNIDFQVIDNDIQASKKEIKMVWEFSDKSNSKRMIIAQEFIIIEYFKYKNFTKLLNEISKVIESFESSHSINVINRLGLRYINIIKIKTGNPMDWDGIVNKNLFASISNFIDDKAKLLKNLQVIEYKENSEYNLTFWFGMHNSEYPNPISRKEFVLDYDCYTTEQIASSNLNEKVILFHETIDKWFELSIEDGLREILNGGADA